MKQFATAIVKYTWHDIIIGIIVIIYYPSIIQRHRTLSNYIYFVFNGTICLNAYLKLWMFYKKYLKP